MDKYTINTGTITYAIRARDALRKSGCKAYMFRKTTGKTEGCGYSVSTDCSEDKIKQVFSQNGIKYRSIVKGDTV